jgi:very-short-patch-repair endonuclease
MRGDAAQMSTEYARNLRKGMTDAERAIWRLLRGRRVEGWLFRRQQPIDRYIVDFICFEARLVIEVDGGQHRQAIRSAMHTFDRKDSMCCDFGTMTS